MSLLYKDLPSFIDWFEGERKKLPAWKQYNPNEVFIGGDFAELFCESSWPSNHKQIEDSFYALFEYICSEFYNYHVSGNEFWDIWQFCLIGGEIKYFAFTYYLEGGSRYYEGKPFEVEGKQIITWTWNECSTG